jgi:hypothetical protein
MPGTWQLQTQDNHDLESKNPTLYQGELKRQPLHCGEPTENLTFQVATKGMGLPDDNKEEDKQHRHCYPVQFEKDSTHLCPPKVLNALSLTLFYFPHSLHTAWHGLELYFSSNHIKSAHYHTTLTTLTTLFCHAPFF